MQRKFCKAAPDASLAAKGAAMGRKAKRKASTAGPDFRRLVSPSGFQVSWVLSVLSLMLSSQIRHPLATVVAGPGGPQQRAE